MYKYGWFALSYRRTPLQYSCLENPMDGRAWWAAVHGVAEGRTRLKRLSSSSSSSSMYSIMSAANSDSYIFLLQCEFLLFLFLLWLLWLGLSKLCGIIVVKVGNFFLFLILEEMISVCNHWEQCLQWVCCIRPLLYWGNCFYVDFLEGFFFF